MFRALNNFKKLYKLCNFTYSRCVTTIQRNVSACAVLHAKLYADNENAYCYNIIAPTFNTRKAFLDQISNAEHITHESLERMSNQNFRHSSASEIVAMFARVHPYCKQHQISLSNQCFDSVVDGLMDNAERLTDAELLALLDLLADYPLAADVKERNFLDTWTCLDDMCCQRIAHWKADMLLCVAEKWYNWKLGRVCNFIFEALDKMARKPAQRLTKDQLVHVFFLMNVSRRRSVSFEYEHAVFENVEAMSVDELAIVALGYFKSQTKVKIPQILSEMLRKAKSAPDIHEVTLCAILKIVRYTSHPSLADQMVDFLEHITPALPKHSTLCVLHAALLGTTLQILHKPSLRIAAQRIASNISSVEQVRLKDIERLLLALTMLDYDPQTTPCIFEASMQELHAARRGAEIVRYQRCLGAALSFLSIKNMYSLELMNKILHPEFVDEVYGKSARAYPRELFVLNMNSYIEVPEYDGPKLDGAKQTKVAKWLTEFAPTKDSGRKHTALDKLLLDVNDVIEEIVGGPEMMFVAHLLPQYIRADVVLCRDKATRQFRQPAGLDKYQFGDIMWAPRIEDAELFAIVVLGWNSTVRGTSDPVGLVRMKMRHLRKLGYTPLAVIWNEFSPLTRQDKRKYILSKLDDST